MSRFTRRQLLSAGLGTAAMGLLSGCATPGIRSVNTAPVLAPAASGEKITLTYWCWLKDAQKVADIWNASHPQVQVEVVWIPGGNAGGYQKLYSALAAGGGPDLAQVEMRSLPEFMLVNGLVDVARYGAQDYAHLYDQTLWGQVSFSGGVYGIPQDSGPMAMFYQPAVLDQVGGTNPGTWDEWAALARELRKKDVYLDCFPLGDASVFTAFAAQAGASWLRPEEDGWVINMTDDATMKVARFSTRPSTRTLSRRRSAPTLPAGLLQPRREPLPPWCPAAGEMPLLKASAAAAANGGWRPCPPGTAADSGQATLADPRQRSWPTASTPAKHSSSRCG